MEELEGRTLLVAKGLFGQCVAAKELASGAIVIDDVTSQRRLGTVRTPCEVFDLDGPDGCLVVFAGTDAGCAEAYEVRLQLPDQQMRCRIVGGIWLSFPERFSPGQVSVVWHDSDARVLHHWTRELHSDEFEWTRYGPLNN
jgi:hypothetical protein